MKKTASGASPYGAAAQEYFEHLDAMSFADLYYQYFSAMLSNKENGHEQEAEEQRLFLDFLLSWRKIPEASRTQLEADCLRRRTSVHKMSVALDRSFRDPNPGLKKQH